MRALSLHEDVLLVQSAVWQTTATLIRNGDEAFLIDSPVLPEEIELLPSLCNQAMFEIVGLIATHADWDHLLGRLAFPDAPLALAETSAARLTGEMGAAARDLREFDSQWYVERDRPLSLPGAEALPVPGFLEIGSAEIELHPADGHTADGMALFARWCGVLVVGDYVSPVEIPMISEGGSLSAYRATLGRLRDLVGDKDCEHVIAGHGGLLDPRRANAIIGEDLAYLDELEAKGADASLPLARTTTEQKRVHAENVARVVPA
jgi:glyoxylase-like metal-dependent hydrolase (beta-lactamase superfamily II)